MRRKLWLYVIAIHAALLLSMAISPVIKPSHAKKSIKVNLVKSVEMIKMARKSETPNTTASPPSAKTNKPPVKATPKTDNTVSPLSSSKKEAKPSIEKKSTYAAKRASPPLSYVVPQALLRDLEESIAKIDPKDDKCCGKKSTKTTPMLGSLHIDRREPLTGSVEEKKRELEYEETLIHFLHEALHLPEVGAVKVKLVLREDGSVAKVVILEAESVKNRKYLETELPRLRFPPLESAARSFVIAFCNEV